MNYYRIIQMVCALFQDLLTISQLMDAPPFLDVVLTQPLAPVADAPVNPETGIGVGPMRPPHGLPHL